MARLMATARLAAIAATLALAACDVAPSREPPLLLYGGFRGYGDPCRVVGRTELPYRFRLPRTTLVGCPRDYDGVELFLAQTDGFRAGTSQGYDLFIVSR